jgi:hypothetical protein
MIRHIAEVFAAVLAIGGSVACGGEAKAAGSGDGQDLAGTLGVLESKSFEAWKAGDKAFWTTFLSEKFVGWGSSGRLDKTSAMRALSGADCRIISYRLSNEQVSRLTSDAAVVTHKTEVDGICGGKQLAPTSYTATVYVREDRQWKAAFRGQSAIVDPMKAAKPASSNDWAKATMYAPDFGILTLRATVDGKCFGQEVWPVWGSSIYVRQGGTWVWSFGINVLAGAG